MGRQLSRGVPTYDFAKISQKLHEIERICTPRGRGAGPKFYYVDPPLINTTLVGKKAGVFFVIIVPQFTVLSIRFLKEWTEY